MIARFETFFFQIEKYLIKISILFDRGRDKVGCSGVKVRVRFGKYVAIHLRPVRDRSGKGSGHNPALKIINYCISHDWFLAFNMDNS